MANQLVCVPGEKGGAQAMKYLIIICILFASCNVFKKSVNTQKNDVSKHQLKVTDSIGRLTVDSKAATITTGWVKESVDSGYDKVTDEVIRDYGDSVITTRITKEKGQKKTEQLSHLSKYDSAGSMITEHSQLQELQEEDSTATVVAVQKDVKRASFMPWWLWLIAAAPVLVIMVYNRKSLLKFLGA
jgi:hypothetical protein